MRWMIFIGLGLMVIVVIMLGRPSSKPELPGIVRNENPRPVLVEHPAPEDSPSLSSPVSEELTQAIARAAVAVRNQGAVRQEIADNPHVTPLSIQEGGRLIGEVSAQEIRHPELKPEIQKFFLDCAQNQETITALRVQCLLRYVRSRQLSALETRTLLADMPVAVQTIYARFMETR